MKLRAMLTALALAGLAALPLATPAPAQTKPKIVFALGSVGMLYLPVYAADVMGYMSEAGIEPDIQVFKAGGGAAMTAIISGDAHVYPGTPGAALRATEKGADVVNFGTLMNQYASNVVIRGAVAKEKGITDASPLADRFKALKGLNLASTGAGSGTHHLALWMLEKGGYNPERDATIVFVPGAREMLAAFELGRIDALILSNPTSDTAVKKLGGFLLFNMAKGDIPDLNGFPYITYSARKSWLEKDEKTTLAMMRALIKAQAALHDPKITLEVRDKIFAKFFQGFDRELFNGAWGDVVKAYPVEPTISQAQLEQVVDFTNKFEAKKMDRALAVKGLADGWVKKAAAK